MTVVDKALFPGKHHHEIAPAIRDECGIATVNSTTFAATRAGNLSRSIQPCVRTAVTRDEKSRLIELSRVR